MKSSEPLKNRYRMLERPYWLKITENARISLPQLGRSAIVLAAILIAVGFITYGHEMGPHIIAAFIGSSARQLLWS